jgi:hypothetical protein
MKRLIRVGVVCAAAGLCALAIPLVGGQSPAAAPGGGGGEEGRPRPPRGILGDHLGAYLTVEGVRATEGLVGTQTLLVDRVNGKRLKKPVAIWVRNLILPSKKRCVLKGYESGRMIGDPPAAIEAAKEQGKEIVVGQAAWQWEPYFVALIVVEPKGLKLFKAKE